ncbi:MAG: hypothetical protein LOD87_13765, partial [Planifilum fulgidum]
MTSHKDSAPQFADDELDASDDVEDLEAAEEKAATRQTPMQKYGFMLLTTAVFLGLWEIGVIITEQPQYLLPKPTVILNVMIERWPLWIDHGWVTLMEVLGGFGLAILVGIPLAILIVYSRLLEAIIYPPLVAFQAVPKIAIAPLFIVWFGFGFSPKLLIAFLIAFFPIVISTVVG